MKSLQDIVRLNQSRTEKTPELAELTNKIKADWGENVLGILLYGSCKDMPDSSEGLVDLCVLLRNYQAHPSFLSGLLNRLIPPNVYFLKGNTRQSKYAVITLKQFEQKMTAPMDHYFWARFSQPFTLLYAASPDVQATIETAQVLAVKTFWRELGLETLDNQDPLAFWSQGLRLTYGCELRPESTDHAETVISRHPTYWREVTETLSTSPSIQPLEPWRLRAKWRLRPLYGKIFNLLRLMKAAGTFANGIDYIAWKIQRHSGVQFEPMPWMKKHPRMAGLAMAWRLWRQGGFR